MRINLNNQNLTLWPNINKDAIDVRINNNQISEIPDSVGDLKALSRIIIDSNKISKISNRLSELEYFKDFRLSNNNISNVPSIVWNLKYLNILILSNNQISKLPEELGNLQSLTQLYLQNNLLETLPDGIGNLSSLEHLFLENNPIEYLPKSISNLGKLKHLSLDGTKLPLPPNYHPNKPQETIKYILENQKDPPSGLNIRDALVFFNFSMKSIKDRFKNIFHEFSKLHEVHFTEINESTDIKQNSTFVLIIVGFDVHDNPNLVFEIIEQSNLMNIPYKVIYQKDTFSGISDIHWEKSKETYDVRTKFENKFKYELIPFNSLDELMELIMNVLKQHRPEVLIKSLELKNIGHFQETIIKFDKKLTCIVGENGQGKSSILKALSLAIIGINNSKLLKNDIYKDLLRIRSISKDGQVFYCEEGGIILHYTIDSIDYQNEIRLVSKDEGRIVEASSSGDFAINSGEYNLKSLIVGFPQLRGRFSRNEKLSKYSQPHIDDLLPLLWNNDDYRLDSFIGWISNLYGETVKERSSNEIGELSTINYVFDLISELTGSPISFITVQQFTPPIVIISTPDSPNGIPMNLISQGFKIVIGWIGYFIQRGAEAFPLTNLSTNATERSILIIDEIDSSIHPVWQSRLLKILREKFTNTQIICTTHSPLMVAGLDRNQILEIQSIGNKIIINQNSFDTWATSYTDILRLIFNTTEFIPKITREELEAQLEHFKDQPVKQEQIKENLDRIVESEMVVDDIKRYESKLEEREKELNNLIEEYRKKNL